MRNPMLNKLKIDIDVCIYLIEFWNKSSSTIEIVVDRKQNRKYNVRKKIKKESMQNIYFEEKQPIKKKW